MFENPNILPEKEWLFYHNKNNNNNIINYNTNNNDSNNLFEINSYPKIIISNATTTTSTNQLTDSATTTTNLTYFNSNENYFINDDFNNITQSINNNYNNYDNITENIPFFLIAAETIGNFLSQYYTPILVFTGSIGNILSVFVFFKTKLRKLSSSYYLSALAISDTCFLIGVFIQWLNFIDIYLYNREFLCQFFTFFSSLCSFLSVWFVVAFTVERFIAVMYPLKRQTMCTVKRAKIVLIGLTLLGALHCLPLIYFASPRLDLHTNSIICDIKLEFKDYMTIINYVDTVVVFVVPFTTIVVLNTFTGCTVWKFATLRRQMTTHKRKQTTQTATKQNEFPTTVYRAPTLKKQTSLIFNCSHPNGKNSIRYSGTVKTGRRKMTNTSQLKVTKMLLIVSTVFICLNLPSYVMRVQTFLETNPSRTTVAVQYVCWFLFLTNFGINFVIYCLSGQNFRRAVLSIFRKPSSNQKDGATQVTVISGSPSYTQSKVTASEILKEFIDNYKKLPGLWQVNNTNQISNTNINSNTIDENIKTLNNNPNINLYKDTKIDGYIKLLELLKKINNEGYMVDNIMKEIGYYRKEQLPLKLNNRELTTTSTKLTSCHEREYKFNNTKNFDQTVTNNTQSFNKDNYKITCANNSSNIDLKMQLPTIIETNLNTDNIELLPLKLELKAMNDEEILIKAWENKLKRIPRIQRLLAENAINDILIKAEMCTLQEN